MPGYNSFMCDVYSSYVTSAYDVFNFKHVNKQINSHQVISSFCLYSCILERLSRIKFESFCVSSYLNKRKKHVIETTFVGQINDNLVALLICITNWNRIWFSNKRKHAHFISTTQILLSRPAFYHVNLILLRSCPSCFACSKQICF